MVGLVVGGFQVSGSIDTWREAQDAEKTARVVEAALNYGNRLIEERDISAEPFLKGKRNDSEVVKARAATDAAGEEFDAAVGSMPDKPGLKRGWTPSATSSRTWSRCARRRTPRSSRVSRPKRATSPSSTR